MTEDDFLAITIFAKQRGVTKSKLMMAGIHNLIQALDYDDFKKLFEKIIQAKNKLHECDLRGADFDGLSDGPFKQESGEA